MLFGVWSDLGRRNQCQGHEFDVGCAPPRCALCRSPVGIAEGRSPTRDRPGVTWRRGNEQWAPNWSERQGVVLGLPAGRPDATAPPGLRPRAHGATTATVPRPAPAGERRAGRGGTSGRASGGGGSRLPSGSSTASSMASLWRWPRHRRQAERSSRAVDGRGRVVMLLSSDRLAACSAGPLYRCGIPIACRTMCSAYHGRGWTMEMKSRILALQRGFGWEQRFTSRDLT
jgi:hypothetical protein